MFIDKLKANNNKSKYMYMDVHNIIIYNGMKKKKEEKKNKKERNKKPLSHIFSIAKCIFGNGKNIQPDTRYYVTSTLDQIILFCYHLLYTQYNLTVPLPDLDDDIWNSQFTVRAPWRLCVPLEKLRILYP